MNAVRDADSGEMGFDQVDRILDGTHAGETIDAQAGTLVFFRDRNSIHRVAPNDGDQTRILAVLGLCCTNRSVTALPLSPDGFSLRPQ